MTNLVKGATDSIASLLGSLKYDKPENPSIVHRLDKETSGVLILARSKAVAREISEVCNRSAHKLIFRLGGCTK